MIIAGTGHRPDKLRAVYRGLDSGGYPSIHQSAVDLLKPTLQGVATHIISGVALGWDMALALTAYQLGIPWTAAIPFRGHEARWTPRQIDSYRKILATATYVFEICPPGFEAWKFQRRNEWMVDHCDLVLACWDGSPSGTANCIEYAQRIGRRVVNAWPEFCEQGEFDLPF